MNGAYGHPTDHHNEMVIKHFSAHLFSPPSSSYAIIKGMSEHLCEVAPGRWDARWLSLYWCIDLTNGSRFAFRVMPSKITAGRQSAKRHCSVASLPCWPVDQGEGILFLLNTSESSAITQTSPSVPWSRWPFHWLLSQSGGYRAASVAELLGQQRAGRQELRQQHLKGISCIEIGHHDHAVSPSWRQGQKESVVTRDPSQRSRGSRQRSRGKPMKDLWDIIME